jgi:CRISPR-associated protein Cas2
MGARSSGAVQVLVIYDIPHDGTRTKVADCCLDYGLDRIQFSAFVGRLSRTHQEELLMRIKRRVGKHGAKVCLIAVAADDWARRLVLEQAEPEAGGERAERPS